MKTNPRKIMSLFLSLLLVLGTLATALPTTVFAAETKTVTLLGVDGTTEISTGSYSVDSVLDLAKITGLDYKDENGKFLTFVDGSGNVYGTDYTVLADATLTATYQEVKGFLSGADLVALIDTSRITSVNHSVSSVTKADGNTYLRIFSPYTAAGGVGFYLTEEEAFTTTVNGVTVIDATADFVNWKIRFQMFRQLNNYDSRLDSCSYTSDFYETVTDNDTTTYILNRPFTHTDYVNAGNTKVYGYRIGPWGFEATSQANTTYDIKYVGSFDSAAIAEAFSFEKYMGLTTPTVTVKGTDGETIVTIEKENGEVIDLVAETGLEYKDESGKFLTFVDEAGNIYGTDYTVDGDATLTATYQAVKGFFSGADLANLPSGRLDAGSYTYSFVTKDDGLTYLRITCATASNPGGIALYFTEDEAFTTTASGVTIIDGTTDYYYPKIRFQMYRQLNNHDSRLDTCIYTSDFAEEITDGETTLYRTTRPLTHTDYVNAGNTKVYGYRVGPWGFEFISRVGAVYDIKYFGSFDNADIAKAFDFDKYTESAIPAVTVKGTDGETIVTLSKEAGETIDLLAETELEYRDENGKFLTFVDGSGNIYGTSYTVTSDATLTATYQEVKGFLSGADLADLIGTTRITSLNHSVSSVTKDDGHTYLRIFSPYTAAGGVGFYLTEEEAFTTTANGVTVIDATADFVNWKIRFQMFRQLNNYDSRLDSCSYTSDFYETVTDNDTTTYILNRPFTHTDYVNAGNTKVYGYRIGPWGFEATSQANTTYDIKYIGSFDSEAIAKVFDFDKYTTETVSGLATVTVKDNSENTIVFENVAPGTQISLDDILAKGDFVSQYQGDDGYYVITGFKNDATSEEVGFTVTATEDASYTAIYETVVIYSGADMANETISVTASYPDSTGKTVVEGEDSKTYFRVYDGAGSTVQHHGFCYHWDFLNRNPIDLSKYRAIRTDFVANAFPKGNPRIAVRLGTREDSGSVMDQGSFSYYYTNSQIAGKNEWRGEAILDIPSTFTGTAYHMRVIPFGAEAFASTDVGYSADIAMDHKFFGFFATSEQAEVFDYEKYLQTADLNVYLRDMNGNTVTLNKFASGDDVSVADIKENLPDGFVSQYFDGDKLYSLSGWETLGGREKELTFNVTDSEILVARYDEAIVYGAAALNEEALSVGVTSGTDHGKKFYADQFRHEYLRMFDNTTGTGHHAFKLDWNFGDELSIDTNTFKVAGVISTTNAAQAENVANNTPRQAFKVFTGKASTDQGGQTSVRFNYAHLKDGDVWTGLSTFELPANITVKGVRFMPFGAETLASTDTGYGEAVYSDIEFIGFFTNTDAAEMFDFTAYKYEIDKQTRYLAGDANADGVVNTIDAVIISRYLASWTGYADGIYDFNCDINEDGFVTPIDVIILLRRLANWTMETPMDTERYYNPAPQPSALGGDNSFANISMSSDDIINELYEPLRAAHPDNITRENIGKDATGTYDMWTYTFTPENYEYTVFVLGGTHGINEAQGYMGLARLMQLVWDDDVRGDDKHMNLLRNKVRFIVVPIVNVWDVSQYANGGTRYSPNNGNNVNLNRNWLLSEPEQEVKNIKAVLARYKDEIDFAYDFHTDPEGFPAWGSYLLIYPNGIYDFFSDRLKEICEYLDNKNFVSKGITIKKAFRGDDLNYPAGSHLDVNENPNYARQNLSSSSTSVMWSEFGIPAATPEHGSRKFGDRIFCGSDDMTAAVELYANMILQQINYDFKEKIALIKGQSN